jgi:hypothetical protein
MSGVTYLSKVQLGREATAGTAVPATTIARWKDCYIKDDLTIYMPPENVGLIVDTDRACIPAKGATLSIPEQDATFEQLLHILEMGVKTASSTKDGLGDGYIYVYDFPTTAQNTPKTYTIEAGDDQEAHEMEYCVVTEFGLSGAAKETLKFTGTIIGRQCSTSAFTTPLTIPNVEEMLFQGCKFYLNDTSTDFGRTQLVNTVLAFDLSVTTGFVGRYTADGNLYYSYVKQTKPIITVSLTMEHNSSSIAEIAKARAKTPRALRILCEGTAFAVAGTTYSKKTAIIDIAGIWTDVPAIEDEDGSSILNFTLQGAYNATLAKFAEITMVTDLAAVP